MFLTRKHIWQLAAAWTKSNRLLINGIASRYLSHMGCSRQDLEGEALLVAHQILSSLFQNEKDLSHMGRYFRVVFRSHCIHMTMGVNVVVGCDIERMNVIREENPIHGDLDQEVIEAALLSLTDRQRQVARWILSQPNPASVELIGQHFGITARGVRKLVNNAIFRIENGHRRICNTVTALR